MFPKCQLKSPNREKMISYLEADITKLRGMSNKVACLTKFNIFKAHKCTSYPHILYNSQLIIHTFRRTQN